MLDKKIVFFDIDGTLYMYNKGVPDDTLKAIELLKKNGHIPVLCTGRTKAMIPKVVLDIGFSGIIAGAGTYVEINNKIISEFSLEESITRRVIDQMKKHNVEPVVEGIENIYFSKIDENKRYCKVKEIFKRDLGEKAKNIEDSEIIRASKLTGHINPQSDIDSLIGLFENDFHFVDHEGKLLEFIPSGYSKAVGIEKMIDILGIDRCNTYAFGDSMNDYEMLKYVKYGVAMGNSSEQFKSEMEYVTEAFDKGGIYSALSKFELI